jgi:hypothetical protein
VWLAFLIDQLDAVRGQECSRPGVADHWREGHALNGVAIHLVELVGVLFELGPGCRRLIRV